MRSIAISAGHYPEARGATHNGISEYPLTLHWAMALCEELHHWNIYPALVPSTHLRTKVAFINDLCKFQDVVCAVEFHFNSGPAGRVWGSETLYCPGSVAGHKMGHKVQEALGAVLPPSRGVKEGWYRMDRPKVVDYHGDVDGDEVIDYFLRATRCPALILEPEFIQNPNVIEVKKRDAINALAKALSEISLGQY